METIFYREKEKFHFEIMSESLPNLPQNFGDIIYGSINGEFKGWVVNVDFHC